MLGVFQDTDLKFRHPITSGNNSSSAIEFRDPENIDLAVGISFLSCLEAEISIYGLSTAILDSRFPVTLDRIRNSAIEFLNPENWG